MTFATKTFTAANGTALTSHDSAFDVFTTGAGSAATIENNELRTRLQAGGYSAALYAFLRGVTLTNFDLWGILRADPEGSEMYPQVRFRQADNDDGTQSHTGYALDLQTPWDNIKINKLGTGELATAAFTFTDNGLHYWWVRAIGSRLRAWVDTGTWANPNADSPDLDVTDGSAPVFSGGFSIEVFGGNAATNQDATYDTITCVGFAPIPNRRTRRAHRALLVR